MAFFQHHLWSHLTSVQSSLECGEWKRTVANWTTTIYGPDPPRFSAPTPSLLVGCRCRRWALGHQCRWSYESETVVVRSKFRARRIPCDVIHLILTICAATVFTESQALP